MIASAQFGCPMVFAFIGLSVRVGRGRKQWHEIFHGVIRFSNRVGCAKCLYRQSYLRVGVGTTVMRSQLTFDIDAQVGRQSGVLGDNSRLGSAVPTCEGETPGQTLVPQIFQPSTGASASCFNGFK